MFVKNKEKIDFKYRKGTYLAVLKALSVSYVDENKVSANELLACYGQRIDIISRDLALQIAPHIKEERKETKRKTPIVVETVKKEELNDKFIEKILGEIDGTQKDDEAPNDNDLGLDELDGINNLESNTGDKGVDDFLNGKTDILPEGTQIISDEEAQKLLEGDNNKKPEGDNNKPDDNNKPKARASKSTAKAKSGKTKSGRGRSKKTPEVK